MNICFPFSAITTQQQAKTALLLNCIMPSIGGVLLSGEKGTAKSTMVRSLAQLLPDMKVINLPLSVTEDMLLGSIDMEKAIQEGCVRLLPGILAKAHGHILYIDEINLLPDNVLNIILDAAASGICRIEREGISHYFPCQFILVGSMNPEEGPLRPQILDRFGFFVELKASTNLRERVQIIKNRILFESDPLAFAQKWQAEEMQTAQKITQAQALVNHIKPTDDIFTLVARICQQAFVAGHRADIALLFGAMAHAALNGKKLVSRTDIATVQSLALAHRIRNVKAPEQDQEQEQHNEQQQPGNNEQPSGQPGQQPEQPTLPQTLQEQALEQENTEPSQADLSPSTTPTTEDSEEYFDPSELKLNRDLLVSQPERHLRRSGSGKRCKTRSNVRRGRYVKAKLPNGKVLDLAFDATLRAAAPFQCIRKKSGLAMNIQAGDLREKVRERRIGNTVLFLVDASGSMGIRRRMSEAKAAVIEMLKQSYVKRDVVGLMTFRNTEASLVLPLTRSVHQAQKLLADIKTGGRTPLAQGLREASSLMMNQLRKDTEIMPVVVLFSDGRATQPSLHTNALAEAQTVAQNISQYGIRFIVVDTECSFIKLGLAKKLAESLNAAYYHLDDIKQDNIQSIINH